MPATTSPPEEFNLPDDPRSGPISPLVEKLLVLLAVVAGFCLRTWGISGLGLSHFDEGVYALSGAWPWSGSFVANQAFYSPPVYPGLIGLISLLVSFGPADPNTALVGVWISIAFSVATIVLAWRIGRDWWLDRRVGVVAAWLVALDGMQIEFARVGLTDATFTFGFLLTLYLFRRALAHEAGWLATLGAGLALGFTWNTKYHGWLPAVLAIAFWLQFPTIGGAVRWLAAVVVGGLCYLPTAIWIHQTHGYDALIAHQAGYFQGPAAIPSGLWEGVVGVAYLSNPWPAVFLTVAALPSFGLGSRSILVGGALFVTSLTMIEPIGWLVLAAMGLHAAFTALGNPRIPVAWFWAALVIPPAMYMPYARLWLPAETLVLIAAAGGAAELPGWWKWRTKSKGLGIDLALVAFIVAARVFRDDGAVQAAPWLPRTASGFRFAAQAARADEVRVGASPYAFVRPAFLVYSLDSPTPPTRIDASFDWNRVGRGYQVLVDRLMHQADDLLSRLPEGSFDESAAIEIANSPVTWQDERRPRTGRASGPLHPSGLQVFIRR